MSEIEEIKEDVKEKEVKKEVEDMPTRDRLSLLLGLILLFLIGGFTIVITLLLQFR